MLTGAIGLALLLILLGRILTYSAPLPVTGPAAIAAAPGGGLVMLAGGQLLLHNRAGVPTSSLDLASVGLAAARPPMLFLDSGELLLAAAADTGVEGTVFNPDGIPEEGVHVSLHLVVEGAENICVASVFTDGNGYFRFEGIDAGDYKLNAIKPHVGHASLIVEVPEVTSVDIYLVGPRKVGPRS